MGKKHKKFNGIKQDDFADLVSRVNSLYPQANRSFNSEWDKKTPRTVFWDHTHVFDSVDQETGKNREAYIKVTEGLHDGFLEIILVTPANTLNFKVRPEFGQLEAYHDNYTAVNGVSSMNYHSSAYMGVDSENDLAKNQAAGFESVLEEEGDAEKFDKDEMEDWLEEHGVGFSVDYEDDDCQCMCHDTSIEDNIFYGETDNHFLHDNDGKLWTDEECERFFNFLMNPENDVKIGNEDDREVCDYDSDDDYGDCVADCAGCDDDYEDCEDNCEFCEDDCERNETKINALADSVCVGDMIRQRNWPTHEFIIITDINDEDGWNYWITFENQNGLIQSGVLGKQLLNTWELIN